VHHDEVRTDRPTDFARAVRDVVRAIPPGTCLSYGEVAAEAGRPGAARGVGQVLRATGEALPWWRVVRADGTLAKGEDQAARLRSEGVGTVGGRVRMGAGRVGQQEATPA
jgi:methylated-DNA-protein-cysteine methyltransferase related protein